MSDVIRLLVVDDHASFRTAVADMIDGDGRFLLVGAVGSGEAAVEVARVTACDLVVMDVRMPGMGGLTAAPAFRRLQPDAVVVLVSTSDLQPARAAAAGARFLPKVAVTPSALVQLWSEEAVTDRTGDDDARDA